jgi:uncharacterized protein (TIGR02246 family)
MTITRNGAALAATAALGLMLGACQKYPKADPGAVKDMIKADEKKWNEQIKANDLEGLISHYADDAYFVAPGAKPAKGSTEIRKIYADALSDSNFALSFSSDVIDPGSGGLAYARGRFTEKYTDPGTHNVMSGSGSYLTVYKLQSDGSWKAVEDFAAADPNSAQPVAAAKPAQRAKMVSF